MSTPRDPDVDHVLLCPCPHAQGDLTAQLQQRGVEVVEVSLMPHDTFVTTITALRFAMGFYEAPGNLTRYLQLLRLSHAVLSTEVLQNQLLYVE